MSIALLPPLPGDAARPEGVSSSRSLRSLQSSRALANAIAIFGTRRLRLEQAGSCGGIVRFDESGKLQIFLPNQAGRVRLAPCTRPVTSRDTGLWAGLNFCGDLRRWSSLRQLARVYQDSSRKLADLLHVSPSAHLGLAVVVHGQNHDGEKLKCPTKALNGATR